MKTMNLCALQAVTPATDARNANGVANPLAKLPGSAYLAGLRESFGWPVSYVGGIGARA